MRILRRICGNCQSMYNNKEYVGVFRCFFLFFGFFIFFMGRTPVCSITVCKNSKSSFSFLFNVYTYVTVCV